MAEFENKFFVLNLKHLKKLHPSMRLLIEEARGNVERFLPNCRYYVCNQDEPYAEDIIDTILRGENEKEKITN